MIYELRLSEIVAQMTGATVECAYATEGEGLKLGSKFLDLSVDLSSAFAQECPPISYYRIVMREPAILRQLAAKPGTVLSVGDRLALFSTDPDEPIDQAPTRAVRFTLAGILRHEGMWSGSQE